jgi:hypothetical protein
VLLKFINRIIEIDKLAAPFTIHSLERRISMQIPVGNAKVNLAGYIDRMDVAGETMRIIDYKTGSAKRSFAGIDALFDRNRAGNSAVLQTLVYSRMISALFGNSYPRVCPSLYVMKDIFDSSFDPRINIARRPPVDSYSSIACEFETRLDELLTEIFMSDEPFVQTTNYAKCEYCQFADICHRREKAPAFRKNILFILILKKK